jgi:hypothetical protein
MYGFVRHKMTLAAAVCAALFAVALATAQESVAPQPQSEAGDSQRNHQILVLRDGGVLTGEIRQENDRFLFKRGGLEMQVRGQHVLLIASSMDDAYAQRRNAIGQGGAAAHLQLAEWCLRHDLIDHATSELAAAQKIEPHNAVAEMLNRRLALARHRAQNQRPKAPPVKVKTVEPRDIQLVSTETNVGELPQGAVELFTRRVQPVLVNNCTTAGCHEAGGQQKFQLDRALLHGLANRRATMRNLTATLALVDHDQPQLSPLITVPRQTHGGMDRPVFGPRHEAALRHLVDWVVVVTKYSPTPTAKHSANGVQTAAAEEIVPETPASQDLRPAQTLNSSGEEQLIPLDSEVAEFGPTPIHQQRIQYGAQLKRWEPRDEFDPEIFNRKYAPTATAPAVVDEPTTDEAAEPAND